MKLKDFFFNLMLAFGYIVLLLAIITSIIGCLYTLYIGMYKVSILALFGTCGAVFILWLFHNGFKTHLAHRAIMAERRP